MKINASPERRSNRGFLSYAARSIGPSFYDDGVPVSTAQMSQRKDQLLGQIDQLPNGERSKALARLREVEEQFPKLNKRRRMGWHFRVAQLVLGGAIAYLLLTVLWSGHETDNTSAALGRTTGYALMGAWTVFALIKLKGVRLYVWSCVAIGIVFGVLSGATNLPFSDRFDIVHGYWQGLFVGLGTAAIVTLFGVTIARLTNSIYAWRETRHAWLTGPVDMLIGDLRSLTKEFPSDEAEPSSKDQEYELDHARIAIRKMMLRGVDTDIRAFTYHYKRQLRTARHWPDKQLSEWCDKVAVATRTAMLPLVRDARTIHPLLQQGSTDLAKVFTRVLLNDPFDEIDVSAETAGWSPRRRRLVRSGVNYLLTVSGVAILLFALLNSFLTGVLAYWGHTTLSERLSVADDVRITLMSVGLGLFSLAVQRVRPNTDAENPTNLISFILGRNT